VIGAPSQTPPPAPIDFARPHKCRLSRAGESHGVPCVPAVAAPVGKPLRPTTGAQKGGYHAE